MLDHVAQRKLIDTVAEQGLFIATHHAVIMKLINPALAQTKRRGGEAKQTEVRIHLFQMSEDLLILAVVVIADAVTLIDNQQGKLAAKQFQVARNGLYAAKHHFSVALFALQSGGKNVGLQAECAIFGVVLRHQLFDVRQHQHASAGQARQFGNHQAFTGSGRENDGGGLPMLAKPGEGGINGFLLIGA